MEDSKAWEDAQRFIFVQSEWCNKSKKSIDKNHKIYERHDDKEIELENIKNVE